ncbi:hypothetical protein FKP32DRAFT_475014 [Trametes sanguinea]|nr:hypothetical protein FKP32DRAFT_475014 [Trametes sanguinea]
MPQTPRVLERQASAVLCSTSTRRAGRSTYRTARRATWTRPATFSLAFSQRACPHPATTRPRPAQALAVVLQSAFRAPDPSARHAAAMYYTSMEAPEAFCARQLLAEAQLAPVRPAYVRMWLWFQLWKVTSGEWRMGAVGRAWVRRRGRNEEDPDVDVEKAAAAVGEECGNRSACVRWDGMTVNISSLESPSMHSGQAQAGFSSVSSLRGAPARHTQNQRPFTHLLNDRKHTSAGWSSWAGAAQ